MIEAILGGHPHLSLKENFFGYTILSNGYRLGYVNTRTSSLLEEEWSNFSLDPLPCVINVKMKRTEFLEIVPWLNTFSKWTVEIVPNCLPQSMEYLFNVDMEYCIGFPSEKDCAIFYLYKDANLAGD